MFPASDLQTSVVNTCFRLRNRPRGRCRFAGGALRPMCFRQGVLMPMSSFFRGVLRPHPRGCYRQGHLEPLGQLAQGYRGFHPPWLTRIMARKTALAPAHVWDPPGPPSGPLPRNASARSGLIARPLGAKPTVGVRKEPLPVPRASD